MVYMVFNLSFIIIMKKILWSEVSRLCDTFKLNTWWKEEAVRIDCDDSKF